MSHTVSCLPRRDFFRLAGGVCSGLGWSATAAKAADTYPAKPVRIINNFAAGGPQDVLIRLVADKLTKSLQQPFIVDYALGAGGSIGAQTVARAAPDGYTLLVTLSSTIEVNPYLYANAGFDPLRSFSPITLLAEFGLVLVVDPRKQWTRISQLVESSQREPLFYASGGVGTPAHLMGEVFCKQTGARISHVPYKGNAPGVMAVLGGEVSTMFSAIPGVLAHVRSGALKALAVTGTSRAKLLPEVPTFSELGVDAMTQSFGHYLLAPKGMNAENIATLQKLATQSLSDESSTTLLRGIGLDPAAMTPKETQDRIEESTAFWKKFIAENQIKVP